MRCSESREPGVTQELAEREAAGLPLGSLDAVVVSYWVGTSHEARHQRPKPDWVTLECDVACPPSNQPDRPCAI